MLRRKIGIVWGSSLELFSSSLPCLLLQAKTLSLEGAPDEKDRRRLIGYARLCSQGESRWKESEEAGVLEMVVEETHGRLMPASLCQQAQLL